MAARLRSRRDQPKGRRRNVARNREIARLRHLIAKNADGVFAFSRADQKIIEHQLGVIAAGQRFVHGRFAFCEQSGQKNCALGLSAGNWRTIVNSTQRSAADAQRRRLLRNFGHKVRPHFSQWFDDAVHSPPGERVIAAWMGGARFTRSCIKKSKKSDAPPSLWHSASVETAVTEQERFYS